MDLTKLSQPEILKLHERVQYHLNEIDRCKNDPVYFINKYVKIITYASPEPVNIELYDYQENLIDNFHKNRFNIVKAPRSSGKTLCGLLSILHYIIFNESKTVLLASIHLQSGACLLKNLKSLYDNLPNFLKPGLGFYTGDILHLQNGTRVTLNVENTRDCDYIFLDEMAYMSQRITDRFNDVLYSRILSSNNAKIVIASTISPTQNIFDEMWKNDRFVKIHIKWDQISYRGIGSDQFKRNTIETIGLDKWMLEYENKRKKIFVGYE